MSLMGLHPGNGENEYVAFGFTSLLWPKLGSVMFIYSVIKYKYCIFWDIGFKYEVICIQHVV